MEYNVVVLKMGRMLNLIRLVEYCFILPIMASCVNGPKTATLVTSEITNIACNSAVCGGEVKSENGWKVERRGVCWNTVSNPTPSDCHTVDGEGIGKFSSRITGLKPNTKYYMRAYAINAAGTGFGQEITFTTRDHEYVDLGLPSGLLWATCNIGADSPEEEGDYFAWGETVTKDTYNWSTYKYCRGSFDSRTKYNLDLDYGAVDKKNCS